MPGSMVLDMSHPLAVAAMRTKKARPAFGARAEAKLAPTAHSAGLGSRSGSGAAGRGAGPASGRAGVHVCARRSTEYDMSTKECPSRIGPHATMYAQIGQRLCAPEV
jgi:hypothetical protein